MTNRKPDNPTNKTARDERLGPSLDEVWPVHSAGGWPQGLIMDRADIYEGRTWIAGPLLDLAQDDALIPLAGCINVQNYTGAIPPSQKASAIVETSSPVKP